MTERPPSDAVEHAVDFSRRWADRLDRYAAERMEELGIPPERIGSGDHKNGIAWCAFNPHEREGGSVSTGGRINVDSGVLNPDQMRYLKSPAPEAWRRARLRHRIDAVIVHEYEEGQRGSHDHAVEHAPDTGLPVGGTSRALLRALRLGEQATRRGGPSPAR